MKAVYWHAHHLPRIFIILLCVFNLLGLSYVQTHPVMVKADYYQEKVAASKLAQQAFFAVKAARIKKKIAINRFVDPQQSGLIGEKLTDITSDQGDIYTKQTTINPNIAALFVSWLKGAGLKKGDTVALNTTGSFPALNIAMLSAIKTLGLKPRIVYSVSASSYGANLPNFTWLDMYQALVKDKVFTYPVLGVSLGGSRDRAHGMNPKARKKLVAHIAASNYPFIDSLHTRDGIAKRIALLETASKNPVRAYINVGGSGASVGLKKKLSGQVAISGVAVKSLASGLIRSVPISLINTNSVAMHFLNQGVPVVNAHNMMHELIGVYHFPRAPHYQPVIAWGNQFYHQRYNQELAIIVLVLSIGLFILLAVLSRKYMLKYTR